MGLDLEERNLHCYTLQKGILPFSSNKMAMIPMVSFHRYRGFRGDHFYSSNAKEIGKNTTTEGEVGSFG
jgi:hypothetical protein